MGSRGVTAVLIGRRGFLGVRTRDGRPAGFVAGDLGRAGESVVPRRGKSCQAGPARQRRLSGLSAGEAGRGVGPTRGWASAVK